MAAERLLIETSAVDGFLLEDGTGVLILEEQHPPHEYSTTGRHSSSTFWRAGPAGRGR